MRKRLDLKKIAFFFKMNASNTRLKCKISNPFLILLMFLIILMLAYYYDVNDSQKKFSFKTNKNTIYERTQESAPDNNFEFHSYSKWPKYTSSEYEKLTSLREICLETFLKENENVMSIENLDLILNSWKSEKNEDCSEFFQLFNLIYSVRIENSKISVSDELSKKLKSWLRNDETLFEKALKQKLIIVYNRLTNEENVYNPLRNKKPAGKPSVSPDLFYQKTINETQEDCDFCSPKKTAVGVLGRLSTNFSYSAANMFPFDSPHDMIMPRKHDFLKMNLEEFKDLFYLASSWFKNTNEKLPHLKYPVLMWDFLFKGGASQTHPHLHITLNEERYYSSFESIRYGAELYFKKTKRNYFSDFDSIHNFLGLNLMYKDANLIFSLTPKKDYDAVILSESLNDDFIELLYALLRTYMLDLNLYPFSLTIHYPSLDINDKKGRIPVYAKIIPRGDISSIRSDISTLELMTTFNSNMDRFETYNTIKKFLSKNLLKR